LAQAFHARGLVRSEFPATITPIIRELMDHDVNIVQMPCPEATYKDLHQNLVREPMSLARYELDQEYRSHCANVAAQVVDQMLAVLENGYSIALVLGIEFSPSCSTILHYTNKGMVKRPGIFASELMKAMRSSQIDVPYIGVNRRGINSTLAKIRSSLEAQE